MNVYKRKVLILLIIALLVLSIGCTKQRCEYDVEDVYLLKRYSILQMEYDFMYENNNKLLTQISDLIDILDVMFYGESELPDEYVNKYLEKTTTDRVKIKEDINDWVKNVKVIIDAINDGEDTFTTDVNLIVKDMEDTIDYLNKTDDIIEGYINKQFYVEEINKMLEESLDYYEKLSKNKLKFYEQKAHYYGLIQKYE